MAQRGLGAIAGARRDVAGTRDHHEAALRLAEALGYTEGIAWAYTGLGEAARLEGDLERAESAYDRALAVSTQGSHRVAMVVNKTLLALLSERLGLAGEAGAVEYDDLDALAGTWTKADGARFEEALRAQRQVDARLWG